MKESGSQLHGGFGGGVVNIGGGGEEVTSADSDVGSGVVGQLAPLHGGAVVMIGGGGGGGVVTKFISEYFLSKTEVLFRSFILCVKTLYTKFLKSCK